MNILELQDDLQGMSVAFLREKAGGKDRNIPGWLADGVLNQKLDALKKAELADGAAGKGQPSVSEQLQQKAGLMALQGMQQKQAQINMGEQMAATPQAVPPDVVQPEEQAQPPEETMMAAHGGLARLPVNSRMFDYGNGGIVAFAEGSKEPVDSENKSKKSFIDELLRKIFGSDDAVPKSSPPPPPPPPPPPAGAARMQEPSRPADPAMVAQQRAGVPAKAASQPRPAPQARPPAVAQPQASPPPAPKPELPASSDYEKMLMEEFKAGPYKQKTVDQIKADEAAFTPQSLRSPAGMAELARLDAMNKQYESNKGGRGMGAVNAGLEAMMRGGNYGSGASNQRLAYEAADLAQMEAQNKGRTAIEATQRAEDVAARTRGLGSLGAEAERAAKSKGERLTSLTAAQGDFQRAASSRYTADMGLAQQTLANMGSKEVAEIHARSAAASANRPGEQERMLAKYLDLRARDPKAAELYMQSFERIKLGGNEPRQTPEQKAAGAAIPSAQTALAAAERAFTTMFAALPKDNARRVEAQQMLDAARERLRVVTAAAGVGDSSPVASGIAAPVPAPAAASKITPADFSAKWATLRPGQKLVGPDGVEYIKK
jgi:hypothetical protein